MKVASNLQLHTEIMDTVWLEKNVWKLEDWLTYNPNTTLNLLVSVNGINHLNFVDGASNTDTFVNFFFEAENSVSENGFPADFQL